MLNIITVVFTSVCLVDFIVFIGVYLYYLVIVILKSPRLANKILAGITVFLFLIFKVLHMPIFIQGYNTEILMRIPGLYYIILALVSVNLCITAFTIIAACNTFINAFYTKNITNSQRFTNIIMPIYHEDKHSLLAAVQSVTELEYSKDKIHLWLAFDDIEESDAYTHFITVYNLESSTEINCYINNVKVTILRLDHGGKKSAQKGAYHEINARYTDLEESLVFFIDSDIILDKNSLNLFNKEFDKGRKNVLTGMISCITSKFNLLTYYQDIEYMTGQLFWRSLEAYMGATTCLPGAFTILRYKTFENVAEKYFSKVDFKDNSDYQRFYLGEDRYLTHLIMKEEPWKIGFCSSAKCSTDAPNTFSSLIKQRRRWYLGHISNDTWMSTSLFLWKTYPVLMLFNLINNMRNTGLYVYILYFIVVFDPRSTILYWVLYIILPVAICWILVSIQYISMSLSKFGLTLFFIPFVLFQPLFNAVFMYYTLFTMKERTWGGIRVYRHSIISSRNGTVAVSGSNGGSSRDSESNSSSDSDDSGSGTGVNTL
jgi:cellulose synthase/poly-beta-1,6-N-acetylglucosamine synthase-like glycosyltransferase